MRRGGARILRAVPGPFPLAACCLLVVFASSARCAEPAGTVDSAGLAVSVPRADTTIAVAKSVAIPDSSPVESHQDTSRVRRPIPWAWIAGGAVVALEGTAAVVLVLQRLGVGVAPDPPPNQVIVSW